MNEEKDEKHISLTYSYLALRKAVGWIGILLPFVLMFGVYLIFNGGLTELTISHYYYSGMGSVFIGALCAIGLFMFFYTGYDKWDNLTGNIAGFLAIIVAWFPTTENGPLGLIGIIHLVAAALLFIALAVFSLFLFTQKEENPTPEKLKRNKIYIICGIMILACILAILIFSLFFSKGDPDSRFVFWAETIALLSFGVSWLTKGETFYPDK